jgi:hypothetical protein
MGHDPLLALSPRGHVKPCGRVDQEAQHEPEGYAASGSRAGRKPETGHQDHPATYLKGPTASQQEADGTDAAPPTFIRGDRGF